MSYYAAITYLSLWKGEIRVPRHPVRLNRTTLECVLDEVHEATGVTPAEIMLDTRVHRVAHARQLAMWKLRQFRSHNAHRYSFPEIGRVFGRDHTTVIAACRAVERRCAEGEVLPNFPAFSTDNPVIHNRDTAQITEDSPDAQENLVA